VGRRSPVGSGRAAPPRWSSVRLPRGPRRDQLPVAPAVRGRRRDRRVAVRLGVREHASSRRRPTRGGPGRSAERCGTSSADRTAPSHRFRAASTGTCACQASNQTRRGAGPHRTRFLGEHTARRGWYRRTFSVFAADQGGNPPPGTLGRVVELDSAARIAEADAYFAAVGADVVEGGDRADYDRTVDRIHIPALAQSTPRCCSMARACMIRPSHEWGSVSVSSPRR
jgi:hypothetical protein